MARTMALFQTVQKIYKTMAIHPSLSQPNRFCSLNVKIQIFLIIVLQTLFASTAFLLFKANTIQALADSFYVSLTHAFCLIYIIIKIWKVADILQLIDQYEQFIQKRKFFYFFGVWFHSSAVLRFRGTLGQIVVFGGSFHLKRELTSKKRSRCLNLQK